MRALPAQDLKRKQLHDHGLHAPRLGRVHAAPKELALEIGKPGVALITPALVGLTEILGPGPDNALGLLPSESKLMDHLGNAVWLPGGKSLRPLPNPPHLPVAIAQLRAPVNPELVHRDAIDRVCHPALEP